MTTVRLAGGALLATRGDVSVGTLVLFLLVWLTHFGHRAVPFHQSLDRTGTKALNADLPLGRDEVVGRGERHVTGDQVREALRAHAVAEGDHGSQVDLKSAYPLRTSGFGPGVERLAMWLMACPDIRRTQLLERYNEVRTIP